MKETTYTSEEVVRHTGVSYRRIDYWDRIGLLSPSVRPSQGQGTPRLYSQDDLDHAVLIAELQRVGVDLGALQRHGVETTIAMLILFLQEQGFIDKTKGRDRGNHRRAAAV